MTDRTKGRPMAVGEALRAYLERSGLGRRLSQPAAARNLHKQ